MKKNLLNLIVVTIFATTLSVSCNSPKENKKEQTTTTVEINEDSLRTSYFKEIGVNYSSLANVGYWLFNIPKDPKIPASTNIKYTAFLYKDMNTNAYYLMERDYVENTLVVRSLFLKKKKEKFIMLFKDMPGLKYEFDKKGNCWETEEGLGTVQGTGEINTEFLD